MNVKIENVEKNVVQLEIELGCEIFEESMNKAFNKNKGKYNIPGFRKGKAPRNIIERYYGEQVLYEDAINFACPDAYDKAVEENNLEPVDRPEIDIKQIGKGQNLIFTARVTVRPEVELGDYFGLDIDKVEAIVTDEDIENEIKKVAERNSRLVTIEDRPVKENDSVNIDFEGSIDGVLFDGGTAEGHTLVIGSGSFIKGFEEQLIGTNVGDELDVNVTFPEDYHSEELAGKPAVFKVKINEIKVKELPEIDDEFAKDVSEFDTLDEYKEDQRKKLMDSKEKEAKRAVQDAVIGKVVENAVADIPDVMVERQIDSYLREMEYSLRYQGMNLENYMQMLGMDMNTVRAQYRDNALKSVKTQLVLEKISKIENVEVTDEQFDKDVEEMAKNYKQEIEDFKKHLREEDIEYIKDTIRVRNTIDMLVEKANIA